jgi:hypothetical protein
MQVLSAPKEFNLRLTYLTYSSLHGEKFNKYDGESRVTLLNDFRRNSSNKLGCLLKWPRSKHVVSHLLYNSFRTGQVKEAI